MDSIKDRLGQLDLKLRQVGGKITMLKRENARLLAENVRLKKQLETNKNHSFVEEKTESELTEKVITGSDTALSISLEAEREELREKIAEYISRIDTCIEDLDKF